MFIDLQFSTDDEEFEEVVGDFETTAAVLGQGEALARSAKPINYLPGIYSIYIYIFLTHIIIMLYYLKVDMVKMKVNRQLKQWFN